MAQNQFVAKKGLIAEDSSIVSGSLILTTKTDGGFLQFDDKITTPEFASGFAGYGTQLYKDENGKWALDTDNLTVRGRMRIYELLINQLRATNGSVWISSTGKVESVGYSGSVNLKEGLIGHWTFDNSGSLTRDYSVFSSSLATVGSPLYSDSGSVLQGGHVIMSASYFKMTGSYTSGFLPTNSYAKVVWFRTTRVPMENLISGESGQHVLYGSGTAIQMSNTWSTPAISHSVAYNDNQWHMVVAQVSASYGELYYDGVLRASGSVGQLASNTGFYIGAFATNNRFTGSLDDVRVYNRTLTQDEITTLYNQRNATKYPSNNLLVHYGFNELAEVADYDSVIRDYTGNYNTGSALNIRITSSVEPGTVGKSAFFTQSVQSHIQLTSSPTVRQALESGSWTVGMWIRASQLVNIGSVYNLFFSAFQTDPVSANGINLGVNTSAGNRIEFNLTSSAGGNTAVSTIIPTGSFYHLVALVDRANLRTQLFVNGSLSSTTTLVNNTFTLNPLTNIFIGRGNGTARHFNGWVEDFRLYNRALTAEEIQSLYQNRGGIILNTSQDANHGFLEGDLIRAQRFTGQGVYRSDAVVTKVDSLTSFRVEPLALANPSLELPQEGFEYVRIGNIYDATRQGAVYLTSDDSNAPYIDVIDGVDSFNRFNTAGTIKTRMGKLDGITSPTFGALTNEYGFWASGSAYLEGGINAVEGKIANLTITADKIYTGTGTHGDANTPFFVSSSGDFSLKSKFVWNQSASTLTIDGTVNAVDGNIGGWWIGSNRLTSSNAEINAGSSFIKLGTGLTTLTTGTGSFLSGSGEFAFNINAENFIRRTSNTLQISSTNFSLDSGNTLHINSANGGLIALAGTDDTYANSTVAFSGSGQGKFGNINIVGGTGGSVFSGTSSLTTTSPGFFISGSGEFSFYSGSNDFIRMSASVLDIRATRAFLSSSTVQILTPSFLFGNTTNYVSGSGGTIVISGSSVSVLTPNFYLGGASNFISGSGGNIRIQSDTFGLSSSGLILSSSAGGLILLSGSTYANSAIAFSGSGHGRFGVINITGSSGGSINTGIGATTNSSGFFLSGSGEFNFYRSAGNLIRGSGTSLTIQATSFDLTASALDVSSTRQVVRLGTNNLSLTTGTGSFLSGSGEFAFNIDSTNFIRRSSNTIQIASTNFSLDSGTTLHVNSANGGLIALGGTDDTYANSTLALSGSGQGKFGNINIDGRNGGSIFNGSSNITTTSSAFFISGSGEVNFALDNNNMFRLSASVLDFRATRAILSSSNVQILTPNFYFGSPTAFISGSGTAIRISGSNLDLLTDKFFLGNESNFISGSSGNIRISGSSVSVLTPNFYFGGSTNFISGSNGNINIASDTFTLNAGNTLYATSTLGGLVTLGGTGTTYSQSAIAFSGSGEGKLANGNISWDANGNALINASVTFTGSIELPDDNQLKFHFPFEDFGKTFIYSSVSSSVFSGSLVGASIANGTFMGSYLSVSSGSATSRLSIASNAISSNLSLGTGSSFTMNIWFRSVLTASGASANAWRSVFTIGGAATVGSFGIALNSDSGGRLVAIGRLSGSSTRREVFFPTATTQNSDWHMATIQWISGSGIVAYLDGDLYGTAGTANDNYFSNDYTLYIGNGVTVAGTSFNYSADLDDARFYQYALTATQIKNLWKTSKYVTATTINGYQIKTGKIQSTNFIDSSGNYSTLGTSIDLSNGTIKTPTLGLDIFGNLTVSGSSVSLNVPTFFFGNASNFISGSGGNIRVSGSNVLVQTPNFYLGGATNFISGSGGNISIASDTFTLNAGNTLYISNTSGGLVTLGGTGTTYALSSIAMSGSGQGKFGSINIDGRNGGSIFTGTTSLTSTSQGFFLSGSGELNFVRSSTEWIRFSASVLDIRTSRATISGSNVTIGAPVFTLDSGNPLYITSTNGGLITIGGTGTTYALSQIAFSGSGQGKVGGITLDGTNNAIFVGAGTYGNSNTPFYFRSGSNNIFSLGSAFTWTGTALSISGSITASAGLIGGFRTTATEISSSGLLLKSNGQITGSNVLFDGGKIGGWTINTTSLSNGDGVNLMSNGTYISTVISNNNMYLGNWQASDKIIIVQGTTGERAFIRAGAYGAYLRAEGTSGSIDITLGNLHEASVFNGLTQYANRQGITVRSGSNIYFDVHASGSSGNVTASLAGFSFNTSQINSSNNSLILKANGQITGSNVLFDGGRVGGFTLSSTEISSSGLLLKSNGQITGSNVLFTGGRIGGWSILTDYLTIEKGINKLVLNGALTSSYYYRDSADNNTVRWSGYGKIFNGTAWTDELGMAVIYRTASSYHPLIWVSQNTQSISGWNITETSFFKTSTNGAVYIYSTDIVLPATASAFSTTSSIHTQSGIATDVTPNHTSSAYIRAGATTNRIRINVASTANTLTITDTYNRNIIDGFSASVWYNDILRTDSTSIYYEQITTENDIAWYDQFNRKYGLVYELFDDITVTRTIDLKSLLDNATYAGTVSMYDKYTRYRIRPTFLAGFSIGGSSYTFTGSYSFNEHRNETYITPSGIYIVSDIVRAL